LVCNIGNLAMNGTATATLVVSDANAELITNTVTAAANQSDANPAINVASVVTTVSTPSADVAVGLADAPNPVLTGAHLTYTIAVTNFGPATATGRHGDGYPPRRHESLSPSVRRESPPTSRARSLPVSAAIGSGGRWAPSISWSRQRSVAPTRTPINLGDTVAVPVQDRPDGDPSKPW
jgi:hypothetical protein